MLISKYKEMCLPDQERFYCYRLTKLQLEKQVEKYGEIKFFSNEKNAIGRNVIQTWCKKLAKRAGIEEWEKCTNHTFRMYGITQQATQTDIPLQERMGLSRHKSTQAYLGYCRASSKSEMKQIMAIRQHNRDTAAFYGTEEGEDEGITANI